MTNVLFRPFVLVIRHSSLTRHLHATCCYNRYVPPDARVRRAAGPINPLRDRGEWIMLVLSRQRDESIIIGDNIVVTIVDVRGDKVRLGIDAPREISVHRREVYEAIQRENQQAAQIRPEDARRIPDNSHNAQ